MVTRFKDGGGKKVIVVGGGTVFHLKPQLALSAPAYGTTAKRTFIFMETMCNSSEYYDVLGQRFVAQLVLTKMADPNSNIETNEDLAHWIGNLDADVAAVLFDATVLDFSGLLYGEGGWPMIIGRATAKLQTKKIGEKKRVDVGLFKTEKAINRIKRALPGVFLVGFKSTFGLSVSEQAAESVSLAEDAFCDIVLSRDGKTGNAILTMGGETKLLDRDADALSVLVGLVMKEINGK